MEVRSVLDEVRGRRYLTLAIVLFAAAGGLLFLPPLPPLWKGSLWSWLAGYLGVAAAILEVRGAAGPIRAGWAARPPAGRLAAAIGAAVLALAGCLALRAAAPDLFERAAREEGLIEPLTLLCYLAGAVLLLSARPGRDEAGARHLGLLAAAFLLLALEEVDYFGIFGSLLGRVDGRYVGSLHDLIGLAVNGGLPAGAVATLVGAVALGGFGLRRRGWLQPAAIAATLRSPAAAAALPGLAFLIAAVLVEAEAFAPVVRPSPEEAIELAGAICLAACALEIAVREGEPAALP